MIEKFMDSFFSVRFRWIFTGMMFMQAVYTVMEGSYLLAFALFALMIVNYLITDVIEKANEKEI